MKIDISTSSIIDCIMGDCTCMPNLGCNRPKPPNVFSCEKPGINIFCRPKPKPPKKPKPPSDSKCKDILCNILFC